MDSFDQHVECQAKHSWKTNVCQSVSQADSLTKHQFLSLPTIAMATPLHLGTDGKDVMNSKQYGTHDRSMGRTVYLPT